MNAQDKLQKVMERTGGGIKHCCGCVFYYNITAFNQEDYGSCRLCCREGLFSDWEEACGKYITNPYCGYTLHTTMPDGSVWTVPIALLIFLRAKHFEKEYLNIRESVMATIELFKDEEEIIKWSDNVQWHEVKKWSREIVKRNLQEGWEQSQKKIVTHNLLA